MSWVLCSLSYDYTGNLIVYIYVLSTMLFCLMTIPVICNVHTVSWVHVLCYLVLWLYSDWVHTLSWVLCYYDYILIEYIHCPEFYALKLYDYILIEYIHCPEYCALMTIFWLCIYRASSAFWPKNRAFHRANFF